jgi:hypothetical protein
VRYPISRYFVYVLDLAVIAIQNRVGFVVTFLVCVFVAFTGYGALIPFHCTQGSHTWVCLGAFYREGISILDFKLSPCCGYNIQSSGLFPDV